MPERRFIQEGGKQRTGRVLRLRDFYGPIPLECLKCCEALPPIQTRPKLSRRWPERGDAAVPGADAAVAVAAADPSIHAAARARHLPRGRAPPRRGRVRPRGQGTHDLPLSSPPRFPFPSCYPTQRQRANWRLPFR
jgi:hypothetical protein